MKAARKEICKKNKNCFLCFETGHNANSCSWEDYKCRNCNGKHNISICTFNNNPQHSRFDNLTNSSNNLANNQSNVLLQTAFVKVGDLHLQKQTQVNVLLDTASQRTYITIDLI